MFVLCSLYIVSTRLTIILDIFDNSNYKLFCDKMYKLFVIETTLSVYVSLSGNSYVASTLLACVAADAC